MRRLLIVLAALAPAAALAAPDDPLSRAIEAARREASATRGLSFKSDVAVRRITAEQFREEIMMRDLRRVFGEGETLAHMETLLKALRLIPADAGLLDLARRFFPATVAANYDPTTKQISFLKEYGDPESMRGTLVHELTHALQDQNFDLMRLLGDKDFDFDHLLALGALVEGDAESTQRTLETGGLLAMTPLETIRTLGQGQVRQYLNRMKGFPRGLARPFIFQYLDGLLFVETVKRARDGFPAIDRAYRDLPESTEQILHPGKYLVRDRPTTIDLAAPPAGYRVLLANTLGELGASIVLAEHIPEPPAEAAAAGWDGDRVMLLERGDEPPVLTWYLTFDTVDEAKEFAAAAALMFKARRPAELASLGLISPESLVQMAGGRAYLLLAKGRDVLIIEGVPEAEAESFAGALLKATKRQVVVEESPFGAGR